MSGDKGMQVLSRSERPPSSANDALVLGAAIVAAVSGAAFGILLRAEASIILYGGALAVSLLSLAVAVRRYFLARFPDVEAIEPRVDVEPTGDESPPLAAIAPVARRPLLARALLAAATFIGLGFLAPVASLGPAPGNALRVTPWDRGRRLVNNDGEYLQPDDVAVGGVASVWPEDNIGVERAAVVLVRLSAEPQAPTNLDWVVDRNLVAYSKVCTHAGCPVGLYRERDNVLFCPCHQSTFDAARGAIPTFGPTARALPQLPLLVDDDGYLAAAGDFVEQIGPAFG